MLTRSTSHAAQPSCVAFRRLCPHLGLPPHACRALGAVSLVLGVALAGAAQGADTTEPFDPGAADFELYAGADGLGLGEGEGAIFGETVLGYGVIQRVSMYLRAGAAANEQLGDGSGEAGFGIFGSPIDTDHFDLDLLLDLGWSPDTLGIIPGLELNLDLEPEQAAAGLYTRAEEAITSREQSIDPDAPPPPDGGEPETETVVAPSTLLTLGTYWTLADGHQLLLEADATVAHRPAADEETFDLGGVALGYNVAVHDAIELINQLFVDLPIRTADRIAAGVSIGIIATVPTAGDDADETKEAKANKPRTARWARPSSSSQAGRF